MKLAAAVIPLRISCILKISVLLPLLWTTSNILSCGSMMKGRRESPWTTEETDLYPAWFLSPVQDEGVAFVTGYGQPDHDEDISLRAAEESALYNRALQEECRISVRLAYIDQRGVRGLIREIEEKGGSLILQKKDIAGLTLIASWVANNSYYGLFAPDTSGAVYVDRTLIDVSAAGPPRWIEEPPREKGFLYAVGHANPDFRECRAWLSAEKDARAQLAMNIETSLKLLLKRYLGTLEWISTLESDLTLRDIRITGRWKNPKSSSYHVCVRVPVDENSASFMDNMHSWMESIPDREALETVPRQELQEKIREIDRILPDED